MRAIKDEMANNQHKNAKSQGENTIKPILKNRIEMKKLS